MTSFSLNIKGKLINFDSPKIMGVINITPDSFYESSRKTNVKEIVTQAEKMLNEGADILDIGGYSSRPHAQAISLEEEMSRVINPIKILRKNFPETLISIDTFRAKIAASAVESGADMVNDISGGMLDELMLDTVATLKVPFIGMHMKGTPQNMTSQTQYENLLFEMMQYFSDLKEKCYKKNIVDCLIDPGFGFSKNLDQNYFLLQNLHLFRQLEMPILVGLSRKSMIYKILGQEPKDALNGTSVLNTLALIGGADLLRVHDTKEAKEVITLVEKVKNVRF